MFGFGDPTKKLLKLINKFAINPEYFKQSIDKINKLVDGGADVNIQSESMQHFMELAFVHADFESIKKYIDFGADLNDTYYNSNPLLRAALNAECDKIVPYLVERHNANVNYVHPEGVWGNALNCVCTSSHVDEPARTSTLLFLLNNGADYNLKVILEFEEDEISFKEMVNSASYSDKEDIIETFNRFLNSKSQ